MPYREDIEIQIGIAELQTDTQIYLTIGLGILAVGIAVIVGFIQIIFSLSSERIIEKTLLSLMGIAGEFATTYFTIFFIRKAQAARRS